MGHPHLATDCARNPTEHTRSHLQVPTVRLNRWWRFPSALWSAVTHVYGDTNGMERELIWLWDAGFRN